MSTNMSSGFRRFTIGLLIAAAICLAGGLLSVMQAQADGRDGRPGAQATVTPAPAPGASYAAGEVLVRLKAGASRSSTRALADSLGVTTSRDLRVQAILPPGQRILLYKSATLTGEALLESALQNPSVIAASLNYRRQVDAVTPNAVSYTHLTLPTIYSV